MTAHRTCPSRPELERSYWTPEDPLRDHVTSCGACRAQWRQIEDLIGLGRNLPSADVDRNAREDLRTRILAEVPPLAEPARRPRSRAWFAVPLFATAAAAAWFLWPRGETASVAEPVLVAATRSQVLGHGGAQYLLASEQPDEIVRLVDGTISVRVDRFDPGSRVRLVAGDAEIEVAASGAVFDATAHGDRLTEIRALHGKVVLRAGGQERTLEPSTVWHAEVALFTVPPATTVPVPAPVPKRTPVPVRPVVAASTADDVKLEAPAPPREDAAPVVVVPAPGADSYAEAWRALRAGEFATAARAFFAAADDPQYAEDARFWRGVSLARDGQSDEAIVAFEGMLAIHSTSARAGEARVIVGWLRFDRGDLGAAMEHFRAATSDPSARIRTSAADGLAAVRARL